MPALNVGQLVTRNWPIKLAALFFALMLYVAVAAQQPITQEFSLRLVVDAPPGRAVKQPPTDVSVLLAGRGSELLKLRSLARVITRSVPDTFAGSLWHIRLQAADIPIPKGVDVQVADISPRDVDVLVDSAAKKEVPVVPRVTLTGDSGFMIQGLVVQPGTVRLVGPGKSLHGIDSVTTPPISIPAASGPFVRTVAIETAPLGTARVNPVEVQISGEVAAVLQRSFPGVVVTTAASGFAGFALATERVVVEASGPEARMRALTRDSLRVIAHLVGHAGPDAYARLKVAAPPGITARAVPDSVGLKPPPTKRKAGRG
jgi:YbbR domain-containing protein